MDALEEFFTAITQDADTNTKFHPHPFDKKNAELVANHNGRDLYFGMFDENLMTAYGMLRFSKDYPDPSLGIAVRPGRQGQGLGSQMMDHLILAAKEAGAPSITLFVYKSNPAYRLYERKGFILLQSERETEEWKGILKF